MKNEYDNIVLKSKEAPTIKEYNSVEEYGPLTATELSTTREYGESFHTEKKIPYSIFRRWRYRPER